jgi:hypothetical protein
MTYCRVRGSTGLAHGERRARSISGLAGAIAIAPRRKEEKKRTLPGSNWRPAALQAAALPLS